VAENIVVYNNTSLKAGMTVSNGMFRINIIEPDIHICTEPGFYADGRFGVRIENVVIVKEAKTLNNFGTKGYLGFEHVTLVSPLSTLNEINMTLL
jgi:Xaa-Pro aminopeptidase